MVQIYTIQYKITCTIKGAKWHLLGTNGLKGANLNEKVHFFFALFQLVQDCSRWGLPVLRPGGKRGPFIPACLLAMTAGHGWLVGIDLWHVGHDCVTWLVGWH